VADMRISSVRFRLLVDIELAPLGGAGAFRGGR